MNRAVATRPGSGVVMTPHRGHPAHPYPPIVTDPLTLAPTGRQHRPLSHRPADMISGWAALPPGPADFSDWAGPAGIPGGWAGPADFSDWAGPAGFLDDWAAPPPTSGELERLFFAALSRAFPLHFSTRPLIPARRNGRTRITNAHVLVRGCAPGTSYCGLFGSWSEVGGYCGGPIVQTLDELVPFLKFRSVSGMAEARGFLAEAVVVRREELRPQSGSYRQHVHMLRGMQDTLSYLGRLLQWLSQQNAPAWSPTANTSDSSATAAMDYTALTRR